MVSWFTCLHFFPLLLLGVTGKHGKGSLESLEGSLKQDSEDGSAGEQLQKIWDASTELIIDRCEKWVAKQGQLSIKERKEAIPKAKREICNWNAFSGFVSGAIPIPGVDLAAGVSAGFTLQAQGACIVAKLRGYDVRDNATQSMILGSLLGEGFSEMMKKSAGKAATVGGQQMGKAALKQLPNQFFKDINKKVFPLLGRHLITKGPQGLLSLGKLVPVFGSVLGAVTGSAVDWYFCRTTIDQADQWVFKMIIKEQEDLRMFLEGNGFEDLVEVLVTKADLDIESICEAEKQDLLDVGVPLGPVLKLLKRLSRAGGPCVPSKSEL